MMWIRRRFRNEEPAASGGVSRALKVMFEASSPLRDCVAIGGIFKVNLFRASLRGR
jgi:hypothetical protein